MGIQCRPLPGTGPALRVCDAAKCGAGTEKPHLRSSDHNRSLTFQEPNKQVLDGSRRTCPNDFGRRSAGRNHSRRPRSPTPSLTSVNVMARGAASTASAARADSDQQHPLRQVSPSGLGCVAETQVLLPTRSGFGQAVEVPHSQLRPDVRVASLSSASVDAAVSGLQQGRGSGRFGVQSCGRRPPIGRSVDAWTSSPASGANLEPMSLRPVGNDGGISGIRTTSVGNARKNAGGEWPSGRQPTGFPRQTRLRPSSVGPTASPAPCRFICAEPSGPIKRGARHFGDGQRLRCVREQQVRATHPATDPDRRISACLYANPRKDRAQCGGDAALGNELGN